MDIASNIAGRLGLKSILLGAALIGSIALYFGRGAGPKSPNNEATASATPPQIRVRPVKAMNMALGDMVYLAQDMGFSVRSAKDAAMESAKIATRVENQLQDLREIYRQESAKNPALVGALVLSFTVSPTGDVSQIKELWSRIADGEFKKAVMAQVGNWSFAGLASETMTVNCPLLFVREGMDITTLIRWEISLTGAAEPAALARVGTSPAPVQQAKFRAPAKPAPAPVARPVTAAPMAEKPAAAAAAKSEHKEFQIKYATSLRKDPNFTSQSLASYTIGTKVTILNKSGEWLEVRVTENGPTGYIRREFVVPVDVARR